MQTTLAKSSSEEGEIFCVSHKSIPGHSCFNPVCANHVKLANSNPTHDLQFGARTKILSLKFETRNTNWQTQLAGSLVTKMF